jgi:hypothetical protein
MLFIKIALSLFFSRLIVPLDFHTMKWRLEAIRPISLLNIQFQMPIIPYEEKNLSRQNLKVVSKPSTGSKGHAQDRRGGHGGMRRTTAGIH